MSIYNIIGLSALAAMLVGGLVLKLILWRMRKNLEGFHGYAKYTQAETAPDEEDIFKTME